MTFNHYAKIKRILNDHDEWIVHRINQPTSATKFNGEIVRYDHYYRVCRPSGEPIRYCKFQQLERFAAAMQLPIEDIPIIEIDSLEYLGPTG